MNPPAEPSVASHDLFVLSDLHMGRGINPETRRYYPLENFFYDEDFAQWCQHLCQEAVRAGRPFRLLFNGDTFDLLRIDPPPDPAGEASRRERRFGPTLTPPQAARTVREIMAGHPRFVAALAHVVAAGHPIYFLPGNHDIEVQWAPVQQAVRDAVHAALVAAYGEQASAHLARLHFLPWFYYEPGRVWVEHGCQYDPENSFRYLLRGALGDLFDDPEHTPSESASPGKEPAEPDASATPEPLPSAEADPRLQAFYELEQDMPLGNFFQRYLYNAFGHITFIVPSTRANWRYVKWLLFNAPALLFRVLFSHGPFTFQVLRRLGQQANRGARRVLATSHETALAALCEQSGLGEQLRAIDAMKEVRADAVQAARAIGWQMLRFVAGLLSVGVAVTALYLFCLSLLSKFVLGSGTEAFLFLMTPLIVTVAAFGGLCWSIIGTSEDVPPRPLRRAAQRIASTLHVPVVSFGHSHDEELWRLDLPNGGRAWYGNTGTWIAVFTHDVLIPRERVQYTFLRVRGTEAELLHWSPSRNHALPVILLDEAKLTKPV